MFGNAQQGKPQPITHQRLFNETYALLAQAVEKGYGKQRIAYNVQDETLVKLLEQNVQVFVAAQNYQQLRDLTNALTDENGFIRSFQAFKKAAEPIIGAYSGYLQAEYDTAIASAQNGRKWIESVNSADTLPFLEYRTANDERVRQSHRPLNGVVLPVNDPFWDSYYPPNGWRCRCLAQQHTASYGERKRTKTKPELDIPPVFRNNPGKTGRIFPEKHPYFKIRKEEFKRVTEKLGITHPFELIYTSKKGGKVFEIPNSQNKIERTSNRKIAKVYADKGFNVRLLPIAKQQGIISYDAFIEELALPIDFKEPKTAKGENAVLQSLRFKKGREKENVAIVLNSKHTIDTIANGLSARLGDGERGKFIKNIHIIMSDNTIIQLTRQEIINEKHFDILRKKGKQL